MASRPSKNSEVYQLVEVFANRKFRLIGRCDVSIDDWLDRLHRQLGPSRLRLLVVVLVDDANGLPDFRAGQEIRIFRTMPLEAPHDPTRPRQRFFGRQLWVIEIGHPRQDFGSRRLCRYVEIIPHPLPRSLSIH